LQIVVDELITSLKNPKVQWVKRLLRKSKYRSEDQAFVVEGVRLIEDVITSGWGIKQIFFSNELNERGMLIVKRCEESGVETDRVDVRVIRGISDTMHPQGIVAVVAKETLPLPDRLDFVLILDQLRDPGNVGTILRSSAAANVQAVFLTPGSADVYSPKVLRSGMGAQFRVPVLHTEWDEINDHRTRSNFHIFLASSNGEKYYHEAEFDQPLALVIGGEAEGASTRAFVIANSVIKIPMPGETESLNAAVAAGILLFEVVRQREQVT
jgi:TrmH family RNA methyltransferase